MIFDDGLEIYSFVELLQMCCLKVEQVDWVVVIVCEKMWLFGC